MNQSALYRNEANYSQQVARPRNTRSRHGQQSSQSSTQTQACVARSVAAHATHVATPPTGQGTPHAPYSLTIQVKSGTHPPKNPTCTCNGAGCIGALWASARAHDATVAVEHLHDPSLSPSSPLINALVPRASCHFRRLRRRVRRRAIPLRRRRTVDDLHLVLGAHRHHHRTGDARDDNQDADHDPGDAAAAAAVR